MRQREFITMITTTLCARQGVAVALIEVADLLGIIVLHFYLVASTSPCTSRGSPRDRCESLRRWAPSPTFKRTDVSETTPTANCMTPTD